MQRENELLCAQHSDFAELYSVDVFWVFWLA